MWKIVKIGVLAATVCWAALACAGGAFPGLNGFLSSMLNKDSGAFSYLMARSLRDLDQNLVAVRSSYVGPIVVTNDLQCILLTP
jgi:hypothetical protein